MSVIAAQTAKQDSAIDKAIAAYLDFARIRYATALGNAPAAQAAGLASSPVPNQVGAAPAQSAPDHAVAPAFNWQPIALVAGLLVAGLVAYRLAK